MSPYRHVRNRHQFKRHHQHRGAAAVLAMMFMVIFGSLAASMAIVAEGNFRTADTHLKINRSAAAAETGMHFLMRRMDEVAKLVDTQSGLITGSQAQTLWYDASDPDSSFAPILVASLANSLHNVLEPSYDAANRSVSVGPISIGTGAPTFGAVLTPHPLTGEDYDDIRYQQEPYLGEGVSSSTPLDSSWVRVRVTATDGQGASAVGRSIEMDFRMAKRIRYAMLSRSRVMIGRNVLVDGPVGSTFSEVDLDNGHPIQVMSDFRGLNSGLDSDLDALVGTIIANDTNGDNRLNTGIAAEVDGLADPASLDLSGDGYIDDFDFFLARFDSNADGTISSGEMTDGASDDVTAMQLFGLIDGFGYAGRSGYGDGELSSEDRYAKIHGSVYVDASMAAWESGAATTAGTGQYEDYLTGPISPDYGDSALEFDSTGNDAYDYEPDDFSVSSYKLLASNSLSAVAPDSNTASPESVPIGSPFPYDYYDRPIYQDRTFTNLYIPKGMNPKFVNCKFVGVVFVDTERTNTDINFNYAGMIDSVGDPVHPDRSVVISGTEYFDTKDLGNNVHFEKCEFHGSVVTAVPLAYTHVRNKLTFTGLTNWYIDTSPYLSSSEKAIYRRSAILAPHYSVEMGTFELPAQDPDTESIELSGTIVAGLLDMRGQIDLTGTILTTFEPLSNTGPVLGDTSPQFNTTIGYFPSSAGDLESNGLPTTGLGRISVTYDPDLPLPDGINGPIEMEALWETYREGGL